MRSVFAVLLVSCALCAGCRRYTAPQDELLPPAAGLAGEEVFRTFTEVQNSRLAALVAARAAERVSNDRNYRIGPDDVLQLHVFDVAELSTSARVRADGNVSLPMIGAMHVSGLTEPECEALLIRRLGEFMRTPQARVTIAEYAAHRVSVIGAVAKPGTYPLKHANFSLIELLSEAGGKTEHSGGALVLIPRSAVRDAASDAGVQPVSQRLDARGALSVTALPKALGEASGAGAAPGAAVVHGIEIDFDALAGSIDRPPLILPLRPGDTIVVPEAGSIHVDGEVKRPGTVKLDARMTLLGAIAAAEGLTYSADSRVVEVIRELGSGRKAAMTVDLEKLALLEGKDVRMRDGDIVRVPSARGRFAVQQVMDFFGGLFNVGVSGSVR